MYAIYVEKDIEMHMDDGAQALDDIDLAASIAAELHRVLSAHGITVEVSHGAVTLDGEADTEQQRAAAYAAARRFCTDVTNSVRLKRPA
ncbi:MAG TPA: BON domain-containing protein [Candidatus Baltobacteraceae bacterium]|nr:BON domain-containing protein [Candidatus Baltobacteraceae bacterium]